MYYMFPRKKAVLFVTKDSENEVIISHNKHKYCAKKKKKKKKKCYKPNICCKNCASYKVGVSFGEDLTMEWRCYLGNLQNRARAVRSG